MGSKARSRISNPTLGRRYFYFRGAETAFFVKQLHGAHMSIARDLRAVVGDRLRTTYHMTYACASHLGISAASCGVPRIRWKLTGFELGVHFPSLKKFQEKCF